MKTCAGTHSKRARQQQVVDSFSVHDYQESENEFMGSLPSEPDSLFDGLQESEFSYQQCADFHRKQREASADQRLKSGNQAVEYYRAQYDRMKAINLAIIDAIRNTFSEEVASALETYMHQKAPFVDLETENLGVFGENYDAFQESGTLLDFKSQGSILEMSNKLQGIITLGIDSLNLTLKSNQHPDSEKNKESAGNSLTDEADSPDQSSLLFALTPSNQSAMTSQQSEILQSDTSHAKLNLSDLSDHWQNSSSDPHCFFKKKGASCCSQSSDEKTSKGIDEISTNRSITTPRTGVISVLECEVCQLCFAPNEFFRHVAYCKPQDCRVTGDQLTSPVTLSSQGFDSCSSFNLKQHLFSDSSFDSLQASKGSKLNFTQMMKNLLSMRNQIETQIDYLSQSKERSDKIQLRKNLEKDLRKIRKVIEEKECQLLSRIDRREQFNKENSKKPDLNRGELNSSRKSNLKKAGVENPGIVRIKSRKR